MSTCQACGLSFPDRKALRSVSSSIVDSTLPNDADSLISIVHSTKRLTISLSAPALNARRNFQLRRLCARTMLPNIHSGVPSAANHLLHKKRFTVIGRPNMHHRETISPAQSNPPPVQLPSLSTSVTNAMSHWALSNDWNGTNGKCIIKLNVTTAPACLKMPPLGMPTKLQNTLGTVAILATRHSLRWRCWSTTRGTHTPPTAIIVTVNFLLMLCGISTSSPITPFTTGTYAIKYIMARNYFSVKVPYDTSLPVVLLRRTPPCRPRPSSHPTYHQNLIYQVVLLYGKWNPAQFRSLHYPRTSYPLVAVLLPSLALRKLHHRLVLSTTATPSTSAINVISYCAHRKGWNDTITNCTPRPSATNVMSYCVLRKD